MQKLILSFIGICLLCFTLPAQNVIQVGKGSYAEYPPEAVAYEDGYFAAPYNWFQQVWPDLNLHENARNKPLPTNDWWTEFLFRGLGRIQPDYHVPPVTVTKDGDRFGTEAWAYPHMVTASAEGFNMFFPKGFSGGGMNKGNPLKINATTVLQANDENIVFTDFESAVWPAGWMVSNNTKNIPGPMATSEITQSPTPTGYVGNRFVNTFLGDDALITLVSPQFTIEKKYIRLYVGGGNYPDNAYVGLFINGQKVKNATGDNGPELKQYTWNVMEYQGQQAEIRIVDNTGGGWGFIMCDNIIFTDSQFGGAGYTPDFSTDAAKVYDWTDIGFTLRSENNSGYMDATIVHGVPFLYVELKDLYPILVPGNTASVYDVAGREVTDFPVILNTFTIEYDNRVYGIHAPSGTKVHQSKGGDFQLEIPDNNRYVVVSALPDRSMLGTYDQYARNKPGNIRFEYEYKVAEGKIVTTFDMDAQNMDTGVTDQPVLMSFLPHHYRTTTKNFNFITGADYPIFIGLMHTGVSQSFSFSYNFGGMPPYLPEPLDMSQDRINRMNSLLTYSSTHFGRNGNSYAKGFGEQTTMMLMAKSLDHPGFEMFKSGVKAELADWLTFNEPERTQKSYYFAKYPNYGALIGFPPGYGSQGFNDLHFHNGYFIAGAARLMMVDKEFKKDYAEMVKLVAKTYANWDHYEGADDNTANYQPFLRTFDPYLGHSFAGGTGDGGGNNQESTSEAINSWFGIYMLGVELNDKSILDCGAMGYMLENLTAGEYWLDMHKENFPLTYEHEYVGILRTDNLAWATYFAGDPAWVLGIQACPVDFFYTDFTINPERMKEINAAMFHDRTTFIYDGKAMHDNDDPFDNIKAMGPYLGGYHLNILNYLDPVKAADWVEKLCQLPGTEGEEWRNHFNTTTNYYMSNAMITYGKPAQGYHTSIPSGAVYENEEGELTYLLYNATHSDKDVDIYKDGTVVKTVKVGAGKYYNSRMTGGSRPSITINNYKDNDKMVLNKEVKINASASDKDGKVLWVDFYFDEELVGTAYVPPYEVSVIPTASGLKEIKAIATDDDGLVSEPFIVKVEVLPIEQTPFNGRQPWNIPQETIYAVQFDEGGPEVACHDNEIDMSGGDNYRPGTGVETENTGNLANSNIGWTNAGEWYEYTVNVQNAGVYSMTAQLASAGGGALRIFINGEDKTGSVSFVSTGSWGDYKDITIGKIPLKEGKQIMRVMVDVTGANLRSYKFVLLPDETIPSEVNAGNDQVITYPGSAVTLAASVKTYGSATITEYEWIQVDSNDPVNIDSPDQASTFVTGLGLGTYIFEVKITDSNGATATDKVIVLVKPIFTSVIPVQKNDTEVIIYPNPFIDQLKIHTGESNKFSKVRLYSITGTVVLEENVRNQQIIQLNTSELKPGHYILSAISESGVISRRVVKQ